MVFAVQGPAGQILSHFLLELGQGAEPQGNIPPLPLCPIATLLFALQGLSCKKRGTEAKVDSETVQFKYISSVSICVQ